MLGLDRVLAWPCVFLLGIAIADAAAAQTVTLPNLIGMDEETARASLASAGVVGKIHVEVDQGGKCVTKSIEEGHVCGQSPGVGKEQAAFLDVWLVLQGRRPREDGQQVEAAAKIAMPHDLFEVPEVEAIERLVSLGFTGSIEVQTTECKYPEGTVCKTDPGSREKIPADADIVVYVQGKRTVDSPYARRPEVEGKTAADAIDALFAANFRAIEFEFVDDVRCKPGVVCKSSGDDEIVSRTSTFSMQVGTAYPGREPTEQFRQPDLRGDDLLTVMKKIDALATRGKVTTQNRACGSDEIEGLGPLQVCNQTPAAGNMTTGRFTRVRLTAEAEAAPKVASTEMPDVVGMSLEEAVAALAAVGLERTVTKEVSSEGCKAGHVCSTNPVAGKRAYGQLVQTLNVGATEATGNAGGDAGAAEAAGGESDEPMDGGADGSAGDAAGESADESGKGGGGFDW